MLLQIQTFMRLNKEQEVDFSAVKKRLNVELKQWFLCGYTCRAEVEAHLEAFGEHLGEMVWK